MASHAQRSLTWATHNRVRVVLPAPAGPVTSDSRPAVAARSGSAGQGVGWGQRRDEPDRRDGKLCGWTHLRHLRDDPPRARLIFGFGHLNPDVEHGQVEVPQPGQDPVQGGPIGEIAIQDGLRPHVHVLEKPGKARAQCLGKADVHSHADQLDAAGPPAASPDPDDILPGAKSLVGPSTPAPSPQ